MVMKRIFACRHLYGTVERSLDHDQQRFLLGISIPYGLGRRIQNDSEPDIAPLSILGFYIRCLEEMLGLLPVPQLDGYSYGLGRKVESR
jgi:hypothetical protein